MRIGRFEIVEELGRGAMGIVWRAHDSRLGRDVALKELVIPPGASPASSAEFVDRFYTEARAVSKLSHPSIVTVFDYGQDDGRAWLAMEVLDGPTFYEVIEAEGEVSPARANGALLQIAEALGAAHHASVIHRDIKPENCFWLDDGTSKVVDFGLARLNTEASRTAVGTVMGTPGYMSPEQVRGQAVSAATDVFSWASTAYHLLTGTPPFGIDDSQAVMYRIVHSDPHPIEALVPDIPAPLAGVINRALSKEPEERYTDGAALAEALRAGEVTARALTPARMPPTRPLPALQVSCGTSMETFSSESQLLTIGRNAASNIYSDNGYVSRDHGRLFALDGVWYYEDTGSTGGSYLGDERIEFLAITSPLALTLGHPQVGDHLVLTPVEPPTPYPVAVQGAASDYYAIEVSFGASIQIFDIESRLLTIGRSLACDIRSDNEYVSRNHGRLFAQDGVWYYEDVGSTGGSYLNDERIEFLAITSPLAPMLGDALAGDLLMMTPIG